MHNPLGQWYPASSYNPCAPCYDPCGRPVSWVPVFCAPIPDPCGGHYPMTVPHELAVDAATPSQETFIGGKGDVHLTLEYLVDAGAPAPKVTLTFTSGGSTSTWTDSGIAEGYHVKDSFMAVQPGTKVTIEVTGAAARLRWCETICC